MNTPPKLFIGSSSEGLRVANALQAVLEADVEATVWDQGVFGLSQGYLESLSKAVHRFEFAVLVLTPDDVVEKRSAKALAARDNVLFEAGLFMGALGRERTYLVACRDDDLDFPSDLAGVSIAKYRRREDGNLRAALTPVADEIRTAMKEAAALPAGDAKATGTLSAIDSLSAALDRQFAGAPLRQVDAKAYASVLNAVRSARPDDVVAAGLAEPAETAIPGIYGMTAGDAVRGLGIMRSLMERGA